MIETHAAGLDDDGDASSLGDDNKGPRERERVLSTPDYVYTPHEQQAVTAVRVRERLRRVVWWYVRG